MSTPVEAIEPTSVTEPNREPRRPWTSSATTVGLPVLSVIAFLALWQVAAASGTWSETFVPFPSTVWHAFVNTMTTHDGGARLPGLPALGAPLHDAATGAGRCDHRRRIGRDPRFGHGIGDMAAEPARTVVDVPARTAAPGVFLPAGDLAGNRRGAEDYIAGARCSSAGSGGHHSCCGRGAGRTGRSGQGPWEPHGRK